MPITGERRTALANEPVSRAEHLGGEVTARRWSPRAGRGRGGHGRRCATPRGASSRRSSSTVSPLEVQPLVERPSTDSASGSVSSRRVKGRPAPVTATNAAASAGSSMSSLAESALAAASCSYASRLPSARPSARWPRRVVPTPRSVLRLDGGSCAWGSDDGVPFTQRHIQAMDRQRICPRMSTAHPRWCAAATLTNSEKEHVVYKAEYIWIDGTEPTAKLRSKTKIVPDGAELPIWASTVRAPTRRPATRATACSSRCSLSRPDPRRRQRPRDVRGVRRRRQAASDEHPRGPGQDGEEVRQARAWFGIEQEYTFMKDGGPYGFPVGGFPRPRAATTAASARTRSSAARSSRSTSTTASPPG